MCGRWIAVLNFE